MLTEEYSKNEMDDPVVTIAERKVIGRIKSIRQSEHWQSRAAGYKPELVFVIRSFEFKDEKKLKYNGAIYTIERTYDSDGVETELICSKGVNKSNQKKDGGKNGDTITDCHKKE